MAAIGNLKRPETNLDAMKYQCAICHRATSPSGHRAIYPFSEMLKRHGIAGERAHAECVAGLVKKRRRVIESLRPIKIDEAE
jgi:hypothetical protein